MLLVFKVLFNYWFEFRNCFFLRVFRLFCDYSLRKFSVLGSRCLVGLYGV